MKSIKCPRSYRKSCLFAVALFAAAAANAAATTYYWRGSESDDPLDPGNYHVKSSASSDVLTVLPSPGDIVQVLNGGYAIKFDDDSAAFLSSLDNVQVRDGSKCVIDISTNACVAAKLYYSGGVGTVIKRGAGTLTLTATGTAAYYAAFIVEQGDLVFPQSGQALNEEYKHSGLVVSNGCRVVLDGGRATSAFKLSFRLSGFSGGGDIAYTNDSVACTLYAGGTDEPFTGTLSGDKLNLQVSGNLMLANNANTFACDNNTDLFFNDGVLGFRKFGNKSSTETSSFGKLNSKLSVQGSGTNMFLCLATEDDGAQSASRVIGDANTGAIGFDGGAYGSFTFEGNLYSLIDANRIKELVLTGSNTTECSWSGDINGWGGGSNYGGYYLTKRGSGTWSMSLIGTTTTKRAKLTGISVENGTLAFYSLAEQGTMCSLGYAPAALLYGYPYNGPTNDVPTVDYAIRLGNAADLTEEGCLEKRHTTTAGSILSCTTRPIAVTGRGRLRNGAATAALSWTGVKSVVPPEDATLVPELSTLTLDGSGTGANALNDVTENVGAAPLRIAKEGSATWSLGGTLAFTGGIDVREGTLNVGTMTSSLPYLRVDSGATLNLTGDAATATGLNIDVNEGVGTISGVTFASAGTISVANVTALPVSIACDLSGCSGVENLSNWTVEQGNLSVSVSSSRIRISKSGFMVIFK